MTNVELFIKRMQEASYETGVMFIPVVVKTEANDGSILHANASIRPAPIGEDERKTIADKLGIEYQPLEK